MHNSSLLIFSNNCRLHDNPSLTAAASHSKALTCIYIIDPQLFIRHPHNKPSIGIQRWHFLKQTLDDLANSLSNLNQKLHVAFGDTVNIVAQLITELDINAIFLSENAGFYENKKNLYLKKRYPLITFYEHTTHTLFSQKNLPFTLTSLPNTFTAFRKIIEPITPRIHSVTPESLPPVCKKNLITKSAMPTFILKQHNQPPSHMLFKGGEFAAMEHIDRYFSDTKASQYKQTRNELDAFTSSTKFSPWLACGAISPLMVLSKLQNYEKNHGANESTYWIFFELLWREYFQWYAHAHKNQLFALRGIKNIPVLTSFYAERFKKWCSGNTPYPIVNACIKQLNTTGYISNRGRQITASAFVNELGLDWRYGASYFEEKLIDYDVASNWGNWQYLAGVGADPRSKRHFNLEKQTHIYDPEQHFIRKWEGHKHASALDSVDAADWPV